MYVCMYVMRPTSTTALSNNRGRILFKCMEIILLMTVSFFKRRVEKNPLSYNEIVCLRGELLPLLIFFSEWL